MTSLQKALGTNLDHRRSKRTHSSLDVLDYITIITGNGTGTRARRVRGERITHGSFYIIELNYRQFKYSLPTTEQKC